MSKFDSLKLVAIKATAPITNRLRQNAPEILTVLGVTGVVAAGALLVRQTLSVQPIVDIHKQNLDLVKNQEITPDYSEKDQNKEITRVYFQTSGKMLKHYGPAVSVGAVGLVCLLASHGILKKQNVALVAAYKAVESTFSNYRERVAEELGEERELDIYRGFRKEEVTDKETGEITTVTHVDPNGFSAYSKFFDEYSPYWNKTAEFNLLYLRNQQNYFNDLLQARKYVYLNTVYKALGIPETQAGQKVGWMISEHGDNYIDFGIYDFDSERARAFVNGHERSIRLDFNVDGIITPQLKAI